MKMIKKLITISVMLAMVLTVGFAGVANAVAAYDDVSFTAETPVTVDGNTLLISNLSKVVSMVVNTSSIDLVLLTNSTITFSSATGRVLTTDLPVATYSCGAGGVSSITIPYNSNYPNVNLTVGAVICDAVAAPVISSVEITGSTTIDVTFSKDMKFITDKDSSTLIAVTTFADVAPASATISGRVLTLTFGSVLTGIKDNSKLVLPTGQVEETGGEDFAGVLAGDNQYVTDLVTINQLYDFVFAVQVGQNFMSVPYDVSTTLANSYTEGSAEISIQTIGDDGGIFANADSYSPLYGYYISSDTALYLRLDKDTSQNSTFLREFTATGWHIIGVASNNVSNSLAGDTDDDVLSLLGTDYDRVVDMSIGQVSDNNQGGACADAPECTYDISVYKALKSTPIITRTMGQIDTTGVGIEFNSGEAYFIYITSASAVYNGEEVDGGADGKSGNLIK